MKVVVTSAMGPDEAYDGIRAAGHELVFARPAAPGGLTEVELLELCRDADGLIAFVVSGEVMASAPKLRAIVASAIGYEKIDVESATNLGILVCNSPTPENFVSVSESVVLLTLALLKRLKRKEARLRDRCAHHRSPRAATIARQTLPPPSAESIDGLLKSKYSRSVVGGRSTL